MELLDNEQQNKFQTFSCGNAKVTFDDGKFAVECIHGNLNDWEIISE